MGNTQHLHNDSNMLVLVSALVEPAQRYATIVAECDPCMSIVSAVVGMLPMMIMAVRMQNGEQCP